MVAFPSLLPAPSGSHPEASSLSAGSPNPAPGVKRCLSCLGHSPFSTRLQGQSQASRVNASHRARPSQGSSTGLSCHSGWIPASPHVSSIRQVAEIKSLSEPQYSQWTNGDLSPEIGPIWIWGLYRVECVGKSNRQLPSCLKAFACAVPTAWHSFLPSLPHLASTSLSSVSA